MKRMLRWIYFLNKRLYRRGIFPLLLMVIFLATCGFTALSGEDSGFVHIVLTHTREVEEGSPPADMIRELLTQDSIVRFTYMEDPQDGILAVEHGQADAVWIFSGASAQKNSPLVRVVEREQTVFLRLTREKLYGILFSSSAEALFVDYAQEHLPMLAHLTQEELLEYFDHAAIDEDFFVIDNPLSGEAVGGYLTAPLRGLLGLLCVLAVMAGVLYDLREEEGKTFSNLPERKRRAVSALSLFLLGLNMGVASLLALWASGLYPISLWEVLCTLVYTLCTVSFCLLLKEIFPKKSSFGAVIPLQVLVMAIVCPVFFEWKQTRGISLLFPTTYYIHSAYDRSYLLYALAYTACCLCLTILIRTVGKKIRR